MSVADYINKYYGPYMCRTDRHKWVLLQEATESVDKIVMCAWCFASRRTPLLTLIHLAKNHNNYWPEVDIM
ncbi:hypothetical protein LCGC14_0970610, partial [marine sediment metagenome]